MAAITGQQSEPVAPATLLGRTLAGRWTILRTLGTGGTSAVYEAVHRNGRRVALKVLHRDLTDHPVARRRFQTEGYAANRVPHPGAVAVLDDGEEADGTLFLVMEFLEGCSLAKRLREFPAMSELEVASVASSVLGVLAVAHDNGVIHRDVKPANIFLTADRNVKLLDFGVAQVHEPSAAAGITQTGATVGTPAFMAPEQAAARADEVDALTDIWALGATMFQMLTSRFVHPAASPSTAIAAAATQHAPPVRMAAPHVSPAMAEIVDRALAFERGERWPNARAMLQALQRAYPGTASEFLPVSQSLETEPDRARVASGEPNPRYAVNVRAALLSAGLVCALISSWLLYEKAHSAEQTAHVHALNTAMAASAVIANSISPSVAAVQNAPLQSVPERVPIPASASSLRSLPPSGARAAAVSPPGRRVSVIAPAASTRAPNGLESMLDQRE